MQTSKVPLVASVLPKVVELGKLVLIPICPGHTQQIHREYTDEVAKLLYTQPCGSFHETENRIRRAITLMGEGKQTTFAVFTIENEFIGCAELKHNNQHPRAIIWITASQQGKGYGTKIFKMLKKYAFDVLRLNFIQMSIALDNKPAIAIVEAAGARKQRATINKCNERGVCGRLAVYRLYR